MGKRLQVKCGLKSEFELFTVAHFGLQEWLAPSSGMASQAKKDEVKEEPKVAASDFQLHLELRCFPLARKSPA